MVSALSPLLTFRRQNGCDAGEKRTSRGEFARLSVRTPAPRPEERQLPLSPVCTLIHVRPKSYSKIEETQTDDDIEQDSTRGARGGTAWRHRRRVRDAPEQ